MGEWNARITGNTGSRRDTGYDFKRDAVGSQCLQLLAAPPKNERIAAFEAHHLLAVLGQPNQQGVDLLLPHGVFVAAFPGINSFAR